VFPHEQRPGRRTSAPGAAIVDPALG